MTIDKSENVQLPRYAEWYRGRTVAITGGYGYLGTGLSEKLRIWGAEVRRATRGRPGAEDDRGRWIGHLTDPKFCDRLVQGADAVFHMSGQTSVAASLNDPVGDLRANVESTLNLLNACAIAGHRPAFIYAGTATEIGFTSGVDSPVTPDAPITIYDANKLAAEHLIGVYSTSKAVAGTTLRIANVFGPGAEKSASDRGVMNKMISRALSGQDLSVFGDGQLVRDYVYIDDLLDAFARVASIAERASERSYMVSGGRGCTLLDAFNLITDVVAELGCRRVSIVSAPWPPHVHPIEQRSFVGDIAPLKALCGWEPGTSLREGIQLTATAFLQAERKLRRSLPGQP